MYWFALKWTDVKEPFFLHVFSLATLQCTYLEGGHDTCLHHRDMYSKLALLYLQHEVGGIFLICFLTNFHGIYTLRICQTLKLRKFKISVFFTTTKAKLFSSAKKMAFCNAVGESLPITPEDHSLFSSFFVILPCVSLFCQCQLRAIFEKASQVYHEAVQN